MGILEQRVEALENQVQSLSEVISSINRRIPKRVEFEIKQTDSNIQIANGPTVVKKRGSLLAVSSMPAGMSKTGQLIMSSVAIILCDDGKIATADLGAIKFITD